MLRALRNVKQAVDALLGLGQSRLPPAAFAVAALPHNSIDDQGTSSSYGLEKLIEDMRTLWGVPKYRTSKPKKQTRKFSYTRLYTPITDLTSCESCGELHQTSTICGKCYDKVRQLTNEIKAKVMAYNPYKGELPNKEIHVKFEDDVETPEVKKGLRIVEMPGERKSWFRAGIQNARKKI